MTINKLFSTGAKMKKLRIVLYQKQLGTPVTRNDANEIREFRPHFVCFPEFFFVNPRHESLTQTEHNQKVQINRIRTLSKELDTVIIGGTMPEINGEMIHNTTFVFDRGSQLGFYRKKNLFFAEEGKITPGTEFKIFSAYGFNFGVLICADIFDDTVFSFMKEHNARVIFSPTFSLHKEETPEDKYKRDREIYVRGAHLADSVIVKVCGVKSEYKPFLQARSLIAGREKILYRVKPHEEDSNLIIKQEIEL